MGESVSRRSRSVLVSPPPTTLVRKIPFLSFVQKRQRKLINQTPTFSLKFTVWTLTLFKFFSNPSKCLFVQRFLYEPNFFFYGQHNLSFLVQPFCRLVLPHAHCSSKRNGFILLRADYMTLYEPGWLTATLLPHGFLIVIWSQFRHIYFHEPIMFLADTSIYRTGADGVRSCLATKPKSTF